MVARRDYVQTMGKRCGRFERSWSRSPKEAAAAATPDDLATEFADLLEVAAALMDAVGLDSRTVNELREQQRIERGGFERRLWLGSTEP